MFPGGGGDNSVVVNIGGTSTGLVDAAKMAADALNTTGAASVSLSDALKVAADQMDLTRATMITLADASSVLGASAAESAAGWLEASTGAEEYGAKLDYLRAQIALTEEQQSQMAATMGGGGGGFMAGAGDGLIGMFGGLGDAVTGAAGKMMGFVEQAGSMVAGLISFSVLNDVIQQVQEFTDSLISLNEATEKNAFSWRYLYGGGNNAQGQAVAQQMVDWTKKFSMQIPYTRQDLLDAVTNLAPMGLSAKGLENYMPTIADLAATRDPNATLAQVAQVIMSASMGYTRMLKYDLKINPQDLIKYGLAATGTGTGIHITDPSTLLPALENYAKAKGLAGAAQDTAHETFWGAWSSFIDRIQNFELDTGHGLFGGLKDDLNSISSWIDTHSDQIAKFSDLMGNTLAGGLKYLTDIIGQLATGLGQSGLFDGLASILGITGATTTAPATTTPSKGTPFPTYHAPKGPVQQHNAHSQKTVDSADASVPVTPPPTTGWQQAGQIIGGALKAIGEGWDAVSKAWSPAVQAAISDVGAAWGDLMKSLTPDDIQGIKNLGGILLSIPWALLSGGIGLVALAINGLTWFINNVVHPMQGFLTSMSSIKDHVGDALGQLGKMKDQLGTWADNLKKNFLTWGGDLIKNLADGIKNGIPGVLSAAGSVAGAIGSVLHHSKPDTGPLANDDTWMPDMMAMFARDIRNGTGLVTSAMSGVASAMVHAMQPSGGYGPAGSVGGPGGGTTIVINGSSTLEVMRIIDYLLAKQGRSANIAARAPGGVNYYTFGTLGTGPR